MTKILIPRSDSVSAKVIEPSDFEGFHSSDIVADYVKSGFTVADNNNGLQCTVAAGVLRLKGLYVQSTATETVTGLSDSTTNHIYVVLARDGNSEAESWSFTTNTTGSTPTDGIKIGTAVTSGGQVTSVTSAPPATSPYKNLIKTVDIQDNAVNGAKIAMGSDAAGDILYNNGTDYVRLAKGNSADILKQGTNAPEWGKLVRSFGHSTSAFSYSSSAALNEGAIVPTVDTTITLPNDSNFKAIANWYISPTGASGMPAGSPHDGWRITFGESPASSVAFPAQFEHNMRFNQDTFAQSAGYQAKDAISFTTIHDCTGQNINIWASFTAGGSSSSEPQFLARTACTVLVYDTWGGTISL